MKFCFQEETFKKIEKAIKDKSRIVQKVFKSGNLKVHVLPLKGEADEQTSKTDAPSKEKEDIKESESA